MHEEALACELERQGLEVKRQLAVPVVYKGRQLPTELRVDLLVRDRVVVECKAVSAYNRVFEAQVLTYLRQLDLNSSSAPSS